MIDLSVSEPWRQLDELKYELEQYQEGLSQRPHAIVGNKIDLPQSKENLDLLQQHVNLPVFGISAQKRLQIEPLIQHLRELYDLHAKS